MIQLPRNACSPLLVLTTTLALASCAPGDAEDANDDTARVDHTRTPALIYPVAARRAGRQGVARIQCDVDAQGHAVRCAPVSGTAPDFVDAAMNYAINARYLPALNHGMPAPGRATLTINFRMRPGQATAAGNSRDVPARIDASATPPIKFPDTREGNWLPPHSVTAFGECIVNTAGVPRNCSVTSDWPPLTEIMSRYLANAHFHPALHDGVPIEAIGRTKMVLAPTRVNDGFGN